MREPAFLFDIGNVLVRFSFTQATERFAAQSEASAEKVLELLSPFKDDLESGQITDEEFIQESVRRIGFRGTTDEFKTIWGDIFTENWPMIEQVKQLAGRYPIYLLSNTNGLHKDWLFTHFDFFKLFNGGVYSHEVSCMKPHEPIFRVAMDTYNLDPAKTYYIDDLSDNIATGKRLGFVSHHYDPDQHERVEQELKLWLPSL